MGFNTVVVLSPFAKTTAVQTGDLVYRSFPYLDDSRVAEQFMLNSKSVRARLSDMFGVNLYMSQPALISEAKNEQRMLPEGKVSKLPKPLPLKMAAGRAITGRRSRRNFADIPVPFSHIASLLFYGDGVSGELTLAGIESEYLQPLKIMIRTAPSGGALYPVDTYLVALSIHGLDSGVYRYAPVDQALVKLGYSEKLREQISSCISIAKEVISVDKAAFVIILSGKLWKSLRKYGNRGLRYMFIEAGEIAENIHIAAYSLGIGTVDLAGFYDAQLEELIGIDGINEHILHVIVGGVPAK